MMGAEQDGQVIKDYHAFWMGHIGDIEHVYTLNKGQLPPDLLEGMRQAYARASQKHLLTVVQASIGKDEVINTARTEALKMFGYTDEELHGLGDITQITMEQLQQAHPSEVEADARAEGGNSEGRACERARALDRAGMGLQAGPAKRQGRDRAREG